MKYLSNPSEELSATEAVREEGARVSEVMQLFVPSQLLFLHTHTAREKERDLS